MCAAAAAAAARPRKTRLGAVRLLCRAVPGLRGQRARCIRAERFLGREISNPGYNSRVLFRNGEQENGKEEKFNAVFVLGVVSMEQSTAVCCTAWELGDSAGFLDAGVCGSCRASMHRRKDYKAAYESKECC